MKDGVQEVAMMHYAFLTALWLLLADQTVVQPKSFCKCGSKEALVESRVGGHPRRDEPGWW